MTDHLFRRSHTWWVRLVVPKKLRQILGRREFIQSCRTTDVNEAKALASILLGKWRLQLLDLRSSAMTSDIEKLLSEHEPTSLDGLMTTGEAADQLGVSVDKVFNAIGHRHLRLWCRVVWVKGWVFERASNVVDRTFVTPSGVRMRSTPPIVQPSFEDFPNAYEYTEHGLVEIHRAFDVLHEIKECREPRITIRAVELKPSGVLFPTDPLVIELDKFLIDGRTFLKCRNKLKEQIPDDQIKKVRESHSNKQQIDQAATLGRKADASYIEAVDAFVDQRLSRTNGNPKEIARLKRSLLLFSDFMGNLRLADISTDTIRHFRDEFLRKVPSRLNHAEAHFGTQGLVETLKAIEDSKSDWPSISPREQDERISTLCRLFKWLKGEWLNIDISEPIRGVSVMTKEQQKEQKLQQKETQRKSFTTEDLSLIFDQSWFKTGNGNLAEASGINRMWATFEYWFPLIAIHGGERISEICQLHLDDIKQTDKGTWYFDINEDTSDKNLKNKDSKRLVPIHPTLIECGLIEWVQVLRDAGFRRLFPELAWGTATRYRKEPVRRMSATLKALGMERDGTKVFHSFRHTVNNILIRQDMDKGLSDLPRKRLLGHTVGESVNTRHYFDGFGADELAPYVASLDTGIKIPAKFDMTAGMASIEKALKRKLGSRRGKEDMGPLNAKLQKKAPTKPN